MTTPRTATVTIPAWAIDEGEGYLTLTLPVGSTGEPGLYKADGTGVFGCVCVYRAPSGGQPHDLVHEVDNCPSHGSAYYDDEE